MPDSASAIGNLRLQALGENLNTWGDPNLNNNFNRLTEMSKGVKVISATAGRALTATNYVDAEYRYACLWFKSGPLSAVATFSVPAQQNKWLVINGEAYDISIWVGSGALAVIPAGKWANVYTDGTNTYATVIVTTAELAASVAAAAASAAAAAASASAAGTSATSAASSAGTATTQKDLAVLAKGYAEEWAINPEDDPVSVAAGGDNTTTFSAVHWANKSQEYAASISDVVVSSRTALKAVDTTVHTVATLNQGTRSGTFVWLTGNYATLITADTAEGIYVKANAIASSSGAWVRIYTRVNVKWFGATGDGTTNDTAAIQAAIDLAMLIGGEVFFPATPDFYRITSALTIDYSDSFYETAYGRRISLVGEGSANTAIIADTGAYASVYQLGNATNISSYFTVRGLRISSSARDAGSTALYIDKCAYLILDDVNLEQCGTGLLAVDVEQIAVRDCKIRYNNDGVIGETGVVTSPNSWSFYNTIIASNAIGGMQIDHVNALNFNGGSIQYNGFIGDGAGFGVLLTDISNGGYATVGFTNMAFEGNGGIADLWLIQDEAQPAIVDLNSAGFIRTVGFHSATITGAANNGSGAIRLTVDSTAALAGKSKVAIWGVAGTTEANSAVPWSFTIIDGTHIDLTGSTFTNAYISGGKVSVVGFANHNILVAGTGGGQRVRIGASMFRFGDGYLQSATRPVISKTNAAATIYSHRSNTFLSATEAPAAGDYRFDAMYLTGTATYDAPSLNNGSSTTTTVTVTGAAVGEPVSVGLTTAVAGFHITGQVTAADTVTVTLTNNSGGTVNLASGTLRATVFKH